MGSCFENGDVGCQFTDVESVNGSEVGEREDKGSAQHKPKRNNPDESERKRNRGTGDHEQYQMSDSEPATHHKDRSEVFAKQVRGRRQRSEGVVVSADYKDGRGRQKPTDRRPKDPDQQRKDGTQQEHHARMRMV